jgi:hypothetical protein
MTISLKLKSRNSAMLKKYHGLKEVAEEASELRQRDRDQECAAVTLLVRLATPPVWDGEDDLYDIHSLDDLALLPNLKLIEDPGTNMLAVPNRLEILATRGIEFGL